MSTLEIVRNSAWSERSDSIIELAKALCKAQAEMGAAKKDSSNPFYKNKYADLASVIEASRPALTNNGLSVLQEPGSKNDKLMMTTTLMHISGEYVRSCVEFPIPKLDPQGMGTSITYARRYTYQAIIGVPSEDDDGNAASLPTQNIEPQKAPLKPIINLKNWTGNEIIKGGKNDGKTWGELSGDTIQWYIDNSKSPAIKAMAQREQVRRDELGMNEFNQDLERGSHEIV